MQKARPAAQNCLQTVLQIQPPLSIRNLLGQDPSSSTGTCPSTPPPRGLHGTWHLDTASSHITGSRKYPLRAGPVPGSRPCAGGAVGNETSGTLGWPPPNRSPCVCPCPTCSLFLTEQPNDPVKNRMLSFLCRALPVTEKVPCPLPLHRRPIPHCPPPSLTQLSSLDSLHPPSTRHLGAFPPTGPWPGAAFPQGAAQPALAKGPPRSPV